jgi:hypothetical protein
MWSVQLPGRLDGEDGGRDRDQHIEERRPRRAELGEDGTEDREERLSPLIQEELGMRRGVSSNEMMRDVILARWASLRQETEDKQQARDGRDNGALRTGALTVAAEAPPEEPGARSDAMQWTRAL